MLKRHVDEERFSSILFDELDRVFGAPTCKVLLIVCGDVRVDRLVTFNQWQSREVFAGRMKGPHVIRIGQSKVLIESMIRRQVQRHGHLNATCHRWLSCNHAASELQRSFARRDSSKLLHLDRGAPRMPTRTL